MTFPVQPRWSAIVLFSIMGMNLAMFRWDIAVQHPEMDLLYQHEKRRRPVYAHHCGLCRRGLSVELVHVNSLDDPLTEIRNIIKTKEDVARLWGCPPSEIKILAIDLDKEFLVGASALLPPKKSTASAVSISTSVPQSTSSEPTAATKGASTTPSTTATNTQPMSKPASAGTATRPQTFFQPVR
ncbi:hypothetical protein EDD21DRAFT_429803 [Dissophora ornata]|nr:hypothetical protein EDD21DRAFT_429803 [Dissophora ornata]